MDIVIPCTCCFVRKTAYDITAVKYFLYNKGSVLLHTSHHLSEMID